MRALIRAFLLVVLALPSVATAARECPRFDGPSLRGTVESKRVREASGLVVSRRQRDVLWVHNDSGHVPRVYAVGVDGADLGSYQLLGGSNYDWEDIALGPGPDPERDYLYVGDVGDNQRIRPTIAVYRVPEPEIVRSKKVVYVQGTVAFELRYPDGPRDAETLLVDPASGDVLVVTKEPRGPASIFRAPPLREPAGEPVVLEELGQLGLVGNSFLGNAITGGDLSAGALLLRGHAVANWWSRRPGQSLVETLGGTPCPAPLAFPSELQGEAVGLGAGDRRYYTIGEGRGVGVYRFQRRDP